LVEFVGLVGFVELKRAGINPPLRYKERFFSVGAGFIPARRTVMSFLAARLAREKVYPRPQDGFLTNLGFVDNRVFEFASAEGCNPDDADAYEQQGGRLWHRCR